MEGENPIGVESVYSLIYTGSRRSMMGSKTPRTLKHLFRSDSVTIIWRVWNRISRTILGSGSNCDLALLGPYVRLVLVLELIKPWFLVYGSPVSVRLLYKFILNLALLVEDKSSSIEYGDKVLLTTVGALKRYVGWSLVLLSCKRLCNAWNEKALLLLERQEWTLFVN
jgi:hypothetical protein